MILRSWIFLILICLVCLLRPLFVQAQMGARTTAIPGSEPKNVQLNALKGGTKIEASWEAPDAAPMYYNLVCNGPTSVDEVVYDTTYIINNLRPCSTYRVIVTSVYPEDNNYPADPVPTKTSDGAPGKPKDIKCEETTNTTVTVSWDTPTSNCIVNNYNLSWSWDVLWNDEKHESDTQNTNEKSFTINDITPWSSVTVTVAAGVYSFFGESVDCISNTEQGIPGKPKDVIVTPDTTSLNISWSPPDAINGVMEGYKVSVTDNEGHPGDTELGPSLWTSIEDLEPCHSYDVNIRAKTSAGYGEPSENEPAIIIVELPPKKVECASDSPRSLTVSWNQSYPLCPVDEYMISWVSSDVSYSEVKSSNDESWLRDDLSQVVDGNDTSFDLPDIKPYKTYTVCVGVETEDEKTCCKQITDQAAPGKVTLISVNTENELVKVTWSPPAEPNGVIDNYKVTWRDEKGKEDEKETNDGSALSTVIEGLSVCSNYQFQVTAHTIADWGTPSDSFLADIGNYVPVSSLSCILDGDKIKCDWSTANPECEVKNFLFSWTENLLWDPLPSDQDPTVTASDTIDGSETSFIIEQVYPYSSVVFCIKIDEGLDEEVCQSTSSPETKPSKPLKLDEKHTNESVDLTWDIPHEVNGVISGWVVTWLHDNQQVGTAQKSTDEHSHKIEKLSPDTEYKITITCQNGAGAGDPAEMMIKTNKNDGGGGNGGGGNGGNGDNPPDIGVIVGGVIGGVAALVLIVIGVFFLVKKRRKSHTPSNDIDMKDHSVVHNGPSYPQHYQPRMSVAPIGGDIKVFQNVQGSNAWPYSQHPYHQNRRQSNHYNYRDSDNYSRYPRHSKFREEDESEEEDKYGSSMGSDDGYSGSKHNEGYYSSDDTQSYSSQERYRH